MTEISDRYNLRGVSASKDEVHHAIRFMDKGLYPNAFCKILPDILGGDINYANVMHADTAGTKTTLAYLYWKETGDVSVWADIAQDALVMNLDDMACVGITNNIIISSTIGRNKHHIPGEVLEAIIKGTMNFIDVMMKYGIHLHHSGGETADVGDIVRTIDVGFTTFARWPKQNLVINNIKPGDLIIGVASYGQTSYEEKYNSGIGSNGLTMARHEILSEYYNRYPESFDPMIPNHLRYNGQWRLTDKTVFNEKEFSINELILSPTRTYLPIIHRVLNEFKASISGLIHNSGGGLTKVLKFIKHLRVVKNNLLPTPPIFQLIDQAGVSKEEMFKVFNVGQRLEIYTDPTSAEAILKSMDEFNITAQVIGYVESSQDTEVVVKSDNETCVYRS